MCQWAGLEAEVEVFNLFAGSIPQEGLSRMERGRKVQSIVPDMRISIRAHNLCHDNRQLIVIAINRNHSASKNNRN